MLLYVTTLLALSQIASSQRIVENDPQHLYFRPNFPKEPAPVYEHEALSIRQHEPVASFTPYTPITTNQAPLINFAPSNNYAPLANQQSVLVHHELTPSTHSATPLHHAAAQPIAQQQDYNAVHYEFSYSVDDDHTGDHKSQHETRHGDVVTGEYQLQQPDGSIRKVEYSADGHSGFNAIVHNSEPDHHFVASQQKY